MRGVLPLACCVLLLCTPLSAAQIYKWVDAQGVTHFSSEPSAQAKSEKVSPNVFQPKAPPSDPSISTQSAHETIKTQAEIDRDVRKQVAKENAELKKYCTELRYNLAHLKNNPRILAEVDGKPTRLTEEDRQARIADIEQSLNERCATVK